MLSYRSNYPNHVHQLTVSVSKHYYVTKDGRLKYQQKPMEIRLGNVAVSERNHVIHYTVRDHCTGLFFSEIHTSKNTTTVEKFLSRAWGQKTDFVFCGIPELLTLPRTVDEFFPTAKESITAIGVGLIEVTSGFQGGVRDVRTIEDALKVVCDESFENASSWVYRTLQFMSMRKSRNGIDDKVTLWQKNAQSIRFPPKEWGNDA